MSDELRKRALEELERAISEYEDDIDQLKTENSKLRELVWDMWDFFCVVPDEPLTFKEELDFSVEVWKRMRELGWKWTDD